MILRGYIDHRNRTEAMFWMIIPL